MTRLSGLLFLVTFSACAGPECLGPSGSLVQIPLATGEYTLRTLFAQSDRLPLGLAEDLRLAVDRDMGTVTLTYTEGETIVTTVWRITQSEYGNLPFP